MKKPSKGQGMMVGLDLGDRFSHFAVLDEGGEVLEEGRVATRREPEQGRSGRCALSGAIGPSGAGTAIAGATPGSQHARGPGAAAFTRCFGIRSYSADQPCPRSGEVRRRQTTDLLDGQLLVRSDSLTLEAPERCASPSEGILA